MSATTISKDILLLDPAIESQRIAERLRELVLQVLKRRGVVVGLSGGVDSSVAAAVAVRAVGRERVLGLLMPEAECSPDSLRLGRLVADALGIEAIREDVTGILDAAGCYDRRDAAIRSVFPALTSESKVKIVLPGLLDEDRYRISHLIVEEPTGRRSRVRLTADSYRAIVAATNFKQRARKMMEYYHADRLQYAVVGTPNRLEYDQGFFVKNGDGAADVKPIAHLFKSQVYQLAGHLEIPEEIRNRPPSTDTYSLEQSQEEFFFSVPYDVLDLCLYAIDRGVPAADLCDATGLMADQVERVYHDIQAKRRHSRYLHSRAHLLAPVHDGGSGS